MSIAFDANLGSTDLNGSATSTFTLTTSAAAAAGARVIVLVSWWATTQTISGITIGGTAGTQDKVVANGSDRFAIYSRYVAAGLASSSSITVTISGAVGAGGVLIGAASFTGVLQTGYLDATSNANTTGASWNSGSASNVTAEALFIGGCGTEDTTNPTTSTAVNGAEIHDRYRVADQQGFVTGYRIETSVASRNVSGTLSNSASTANTGALAIYGADLADPVPPFLVMAPYAA